jgi:hypothetical protein
MRPIESSPVTGGETGNFERLLLCASLHNQILQLCGTTFASTKRAANRNVYRKSVHLSPQIQTPTSVQCIGKQRHLLHSVSCGLHFALAAFQDILQARSARSGRICVSAV